MENSKRPLSDLMKEITHQGKSFNPYYTWRIYQEKIHKLVTVGLHECEFPLGLYRLLVDHNFNVEGL